MRKALEGTPSTATVNYRPAIRALIDFRGDFEQLSITMEQSWSQNQGRPLRYTKEFLESCFEYPHATYKLAPAIYHGSELQAFIAGFPRSVTYHGKQRKILLVTFLTAAKAVKNRGYGIVVWSELVNRARVLGFDGMINYCVEGDPMNGMIVDCCARARVPVDRVFSVRYLSSILWPRSVTDEITKVSTEDAVSRFLDLASSISESVPLARLWTRPEAAWQLSRAGAVAAQHKDGTSQGILAGYIMESADRNRTKNLLIEDILWGSLRHEERVLLVQQLTAKASTRGARIAVVPDLGYSDLEPFRACGFRLSSRIVHTYLTWWTDHTESRGVSSFYLDVL